MNSEIEIKLTDTLFTITQRYPETIDLFVANGFPQMETASKRETMGSVITLDMAMKSKNKNSKLFLQLLKEVINQKKDMADEGEGINDFSNSCDIAGVLPCPVKIPLLDGFKTFSKEYYKQHGNGINYRLKSASGGSLGLKMRYGMLKMKQKSPTYLYLQDLNSFLIKS
ncbi:DUF1858 domain-containing protein [Thiospirochaeta perfilievii]|uniref:DUF1858 domain-containing protein n=1 Tax=Thiospirochaeta perfilievii TaxID=252967 RepID=A0A5C1QB54_9SPIO|nr:DUF1858 domain-containing protein [Thiospirochaeta perfilievii]QEN05353.1 DUF1858 domain-containing protein [Thiospirochaeta perfilievii]